MSLSNILSKSCTAVCPTHKAVETTFRSAWAGSTDCRGAEGFGFLLLTDCARGQLLCLHGD